METRYHCKICKSWGFGPSITGVGCTFCDGTEGGNPSEKEEKKENIKMEYSKLISVTAEVHGFHQWTDAPEPRKYLSYPHRHLFVITAYLPVTASDRETEFHDLKDQLIANLPGLQDESGVYDFKGMSCEHIGEAILSVMPDLVMIEVSEDHECGAVIKKKGEAEPLISWSSPHPVPFVLDKPYVVTLCGSTKFREEYEMASFILEQLGIATLSVGGFMHAHNLETSVELKMSYDKLHISKISMSDGILVLNRGGYIGRSTASEIAFARDTHKNVYMLEGEDDLIGKNVKFIHAEAYKYEKYWKGKVQFPFIVRNSVIEFAKVMEIKLAENDKKGGWEKRNIYPDLFDRLTVEVNELRQSIDSGEDTEIMNEAADVGNFAHMIFDNVTNKRRDSWTWT